MLNELSIRVLHALPEAAFYLSSGGHVLEANAPARELLGIAADAELPCELAPLLADEAERTAATIRTWARSVESLPAALTVITTDGATRKLSCSGSVVLPKRGASDAVVLVRLAKRSEASPFVLLNEKIAQLNVEAARREQVEESLRQSEAALRERAQEAEALNRSKDEFLATLSHELRTPLNAILGWASILQGHVTDPYVTKAVEVIYRNSQAQARLIEDLLDVSRIVSGKMRIQPRSADLVAIVREAVEVIRPSAEAKEIDVTLALPDEGCALVVDPDRLLQAVWNLLSNSVKFTERGGSVAVTLHREGSRVALSVRDTGRGIEADFLPCVFDRFRQGDSSATRRFAGLGLGLSLVRHIVELHGGSVEAESAGLNMGATFTMTLPVRAIAPERTGAEGAEGGAPRLRGLRVLVVDDEPDARELLKEVLIRAGSEVEVAASAAEAFEVVRRSRPDVIVSDIAMPDEDGYSLLRRVRCLPADEGGRTPAVALSAYARLQDRAQARAAGFDEHVAKPADADEVIATVALAGRRMVKRVALA